MLCVAEIEGGAVSHAYFCRSNEAPIHQITRGGYLSGLELLLAKNADVNAQDK